eukprot:m51a1_g3548 putative fanconi anemia group m protein (1619) ;mRNA; r:997641-1008800
MAEHQAALDRVKRHTVAPGVISRLQPSDWVRLNVGGTVFCTTRATLCVDKGSMLAKMFQSGSAFVSSEMDETGAFLLDRDPTYFRPLLNFLRTGRLTLDPDINPDGVLVEAEFFQVRALIERLQTELRPDYTREAFVQRLGSCATAHPTFMRVRLCGLDLGGLNLAGASFLKSSLQGASFVRTNLKQAVFTKATADRSSFSHAQLAGAAMKFAALSHCNFTWAKTRNANFSGANLSGSDFSKAQLQGALFQKACLRGCKFRGANLEHAKLQEADLRGADLTGACLTECHLTDADMRDAVIDWSAVASGHPRMYLKGAAVTRAQQAEIPEEIRVRLELNVIPSPAPPIDSLPMGKRVQDEISRAPVVVFMRGIQQDAINDRFHKRLLVLLEQLGTPYVCRNAFDDNLDSALTMLTSKLFLPKEISDFDDDDERPPVFRVSPVAPPPPPTSASSAPAARDDVIVIEDDIADDAEAIAALLAAEEAAAAASSRASAAQQSPPAPQPAAPVAAPQSPQGPPSQPQPQLALPAVATPAGKRRPAQAEAATVATVTPSRRRTAKADGPAAVGESPQLRGGPLAVQPARGSDSPAQAARGSDIPAQAAAATTGPSPLRRRARPADPLVFPGDEPPAPGCPSPLRVVCRNASEAAPERDPETEGTWVYPEDAAHPRREYQYAIARAALEANTLVCLPTGLGKTLVAAVVMANFHRWFPRGKVVFMAPTRPLVAQQIIECKRLTGLSDNVMSEMTGNTSPEQRAVEWGEKNVFFVTPQIVQNDIKQGKCPAASIRLLVVDEAHRAQGNHAYACVVRSVAEATNYFRVLALTASPGADSKTVQHLVSNLRISRIEARTDDDPDVAPYVHARDVEVLTVPLTERLQNVRAKFAEILRGPVNKLVSLGVYYDRDVERGSRYKLLSAREQMRGSPRGLDRNAMCAAEACFGIAISLYHCYNLLMNHGLTQFLASLRSIESDAVEGTSRAKKDLVAMQEWRELMVLVEAEAAAQGQSQRHPKLALLEEVVVSHFANHDPSATRVMVFTQYRDSVTQIVEILASHVPTIRVASFIGQATGKSGIGIKQSDQIEIVREAAAYKRGEAKSKNLKRVVASKSITLCPEGPELVAKDLRPVFRVFGEEGRSATADAGEDRQQVAVSTRKFEIDAYPAWQALPTQSVASAAGEQPDKAKIEDEQSNDGKTRKHKEKEKKKASSSSSSDSDDSGKHKHKSRHHHSDHKHKSKKHKHHKHKHASSSDSESESESRKKSSKKHKDKHKEKKEKEEREKDKSTKSKDKEGKKRKREEPESDAEQSKKRRRKNKEQTEPKKTGPPTKAEDTSKPQQKPCGTDANEVKAVEKPKPRASKPVVMLAQFLYNPSEHKFQAAGPQPSGTKASGDEEEPTRSQDHYSQSFVSDKIEYATQSSADEAEGSDSDAGAGDEMAMYRMSLLSQQPAGGPFTTPEKFRRSRLKLKLGDLSEKARGNLSNDEGSDYDSGLEDSDGLALHLDRLGARPVACPFSFLGTAAFGSADNCGCVIRRRLASIRSKPGEAESVAALCARAMDKYKRVKLVLERSPLEKCFEIVNCKSTGEIKQHTASRFYASMSYIRRNIPLLPSEHWGPPKPLVSPSAE